MTKLLYSADQVTGVASESAVEVVGVRSVRRAVEILELFDEDRSVLTIRDVVERTGLAKTTVTRLMRTLVQMGLLWVAEAGYVPGPGLWRWAYLGQRALELPPALRSLMDKLARDHQETVNLYVARDLNRLCIAQAESSRPLRHIVNVGDEFPLWTGATGKILLAAATEQTLQRVADSVLPGPALSSLRVEIDKVRQLGFAVSHGEREAGVSAVSVPVRDDSSGTTLALGMSGASVRFTNERVAEFADALLRAAQEISVSNMALIIEGAR